MRKTVFCLLFLLVVLAFAGIQDAKAQEKMSCVVGKTFIKIHAEPFGRVVSKLKKGTKVFWEGEQGGDTTSWAKISVYRRGKYVVLGWVVYGNGTLKCNW